MDERIVARDYGRVYRGEGDSHPHACWDGVVYLAYTAFDETVGEEVERMEVVPCRRCAEALGRPKR